jgi:Ca2+-binding RTX toxin-like protein
VAEWCRLDDALQALLAEHPAASTSRTNSATTPRWPTTSRSTSTAAIDDIAFSGDVLCGGDGEDTILGDQGLVVDIVEDGGRERDIEPRQPFVSTTIFEEGTRTRQVELTQEPIHDPFQTNVGGNDLILGGPGGDAIHGGAGDDIINGNAGDNYIFGGDGDDVIWGGRGDDHLYSGHGDTYLDVRPRPETPGFAGDPPAWFFVGIEADTYQGIDQIYGGWGSDVLQADEGDNGPVQGDRLMAWAGVHNLYYVCPGTYGSWISIRNIEPGLLDYLIAKAEGHGALTPGTSGTSGFRELALVYNRDMRHNASPPHPETPGHFTCGVADPGE